MVKKIIFAVAAVSLGRRGRNCCRGIAIWLEKIMIWDLRKI